MKASLNITKLANGWEINTRCEGLNFAKRTFSRTPNGFSLITGNTDWKETPYGAYCPPLNNDGSIHQEAYPNITIAI